MTYRESVHASPVVGYYTLQLLGGENAQKVSLEEKFQPRGHRHRPCVFPIFCDPKPINYFFKEKKMMHFNILRYVI